MLYCLTSLDSEGNKLYKIGYADDVESRLTQYLAHNPSCKLVRVTKGSRVDERCIHDYLHLKGFGKYRKEWYVNDKCVENILSLPMEEITDFLWENKKSVFSKAKLKNSVPWLNLYKRLERLRKSKKR